MKGKIRNLFPGGNTPEGFYSYYQYILGQKEASSIICLKGGPGTGKSSFMKNIGRYFTEHGEDVDYFWCSADPDSLDGVLLRERKVAILDGTSPHIVDPQNPGAVDMIINLGEFWNGELIRQQKDYIMQSSQKIKRWFSYAYSNLKAASAMASSINCTYNEMILPGELYKEGAGIINRELARHPIGLSEGKRKKYFASAITSAGLVSHIDSLAEEYGKVYILMAPAGFSTETILKIISENTVHRGFTVEEFYCPMMPETKLEHLLIPELDIAFVTSNPYHEVEINADETEVKVLELRDCIDWNRMEPFAESISYFEEQSRQLLNKSLGFLRLAKQEHDRLEGYYVPNMNFKKIEELTSEIIGKIVGKVL